MAVDIQKDIEDFGQLRKAWEPLLSADKKRLLQRIQGYAGTGLLPGSPNLPKLNKKQKLKQLINEYL